MVEGLFFNIESLGYPIEMQATPWAIALLWALFLAECVGVISLPNLQPRGHLIGVVTCHFGHGSLAHLISNSIALATFLSLYLIFSGEDFMGLAVMSLIASSVYWLIGPGNVQTRGASIALYALGGWWLVYCVVSGFIGWFITSSIVLIAIGFFDAMDVTVARHTRVDVFGHFLGFAAGISWALWSFHKAGRI